MDCHFKTSAGLCIIGSCLANCPVEPWTGVCETCSRSTRPHALNYVTASIAHAHYRHLGEFEQADELVTRFARQGYFVLGLPDDGAPAPPPLPSIAEGPGTELHSLLSAKGYLPSPACPCLFWIREMNRNPTAWTLRNLPAIVKAMLAEFKRQFPRSRVPRWLRRWKAGGFVRKACRIWDRKQGAA